MFGAANMAGATSGIQRCGTWNPDRRVELQIAAIVSCRVIRTNSTTTEQLIPDSRLTAPPGQT